MIQEDRTLGLILAGGKATRFGRDKRYEPLGGKPLISHAISRLEPQVSLLAISANEQVFGQESRQLLHDAATNQGPLFGILAGIEFAKQRGFKWVVTAPADSPFAPLDLVERLTRNGEKQVCFAQQDEQLHPIFGAWNTNVINELKALVNSGERKIDRASEKLGGYSSEEWGSGNYFFNINRPDDIKKAKQLYEASRSSS